MPELARVQVGDVQDVGPPVLFAEGVRLLAAGLPCRPVAEDREDVYVDHQDEEVHRSLPYTSDIYIKMSQTYM